MNGNYAMIKKREFILRAMEKGKKRMIPVLPIKR